MANINELHAEQMRRVLVKIGEDSGGSKLDDWIDSVLDQPLQGMCDAVDMLHTMACTRHGEIERCAYYTEEEKPENMWKSKAHRYWLARAEFISKRSGLEGYDLAKAVRIAAEAYNHMADGSPNWRLAECLALRLMANGRASILLQSK